MKLSKKNTNILFYLLFCVVLLFAFLIRILYIWKKGFWYDEILTMRFEAPKASKISFDQIRFLNDYLIYQLKPYWSSEFIVRLPNLIASGLSVAVLGLWMKKALGKIPAIIAMLSLAISPCFVQHTCLCRAYGLLALFVLLNCWSAYEISEAPKKLGWYLLFIFSAIGILITRMEGIIIPAVFIFTLPFMLLLKEKISTKKIAAVVFVILIVGVIGWFGGEIIYKKALTFSMDAMGTLPDKIPFEKFVVKAGKGVVNELSIKNLNMSLHHNFRYDKGNIYIKIILLIGIIYLFFKNTKMAIITLLLIIFAFPTTKWLLECFYKVPFDSRHMQHATPGFIIIFVAGTFCFTELSKKIKNTKIKLPAVFFAWLWCGAILIGYIKTAGAATVELIKYNRIADWKQIALLSKKINDKNIFVNGGGRGIEFGYYKPLFSYGNLNTAFSKLGHSEKVYYFGGNKKNEANVLKIKNRDVVRIPFDPFAVFVIYKNESNYWGRVEEEMRLALSIAPRHIQIFNELRAAEIMLGKKNIPEAKIVINDENDAALLNVKKWKPLAGWGEIEKQKWGSFRWSNGKNCALILPEYKKKLQKIILIGLPFYDDKLGGQEISLFLGNRKIGTKKVSGGKQKITFDLPMNLAESERRLTLSFGNPVAPAAIGRGGDPRMLALGLSEIQLSFYKKIPENTLRIGEKGAESFLGETWSKSEKWTDGKTFRWIDGKTAEIFWTGEKSDKPRGWEIEVLPFVVNSKRQKMSIEQDGVLLTNLFLQNCWAKYKITAPPMKNGYCKLKFIFDYAVKPKDVGMGDDTRALSAAVASIKRE